MADNNSGIKGIGVVITIIALITGISSIVTPMKDRITTIEKNQIAIELRINSQVNKLDRSIEKNNDRINDHIEKNEGIISRMDERIKYTLKNLDRLEKECKELQKEVLEFHKKQGDIK